MKNIDLDDETDAYDQILKFFNKKDRTPLLTEVWKDQTYVNLMKFLDENLAHPEKYENYQLVQNAIILILSLFHDLSPDRFTSVGKDLRVSDEEEKTSIHNLLKAEFLD